jgi:selenocysteine lyase/cysteine desulfurase
MAGRDATEIVHRLRDLNINTSAATNEDGSPVPVVRVSPHYYNTREEVDTLVDAIEALIQEERR